MKLAAIKNYSDTSDILGYAQKNKLTVHEITGRVKEVNDITHLIYTCIKHAEDRGCIEFSFKEVRSTYNINDETHSWNVVIMGFSKS